MKLTVLALSFAITIASSTAFAVTTTIPDSSLTPSGGYYANNIGGVALTANDDGSTQISLPFTYNFFGTNYNSLFINNNGNVSFNTGLSQFVPSGPTGASVPVISPWFADVDTRGTGSGLVHYQTDVANQLVVTWDRVGYFSGGSDLLNSFQLVLRGPGYSIPFGEGSIGFFYGDMQWERTGTSQVAAIGFGDGAGNAEVLASSLQPGLNTLVANKHIWFDQNLVVVPPTTAVPGPIAGAGLIPLVGLCAVWFARRRRERVTA